MCVCTYMLFHSGDFSCHTVDHKNVFMEARKGCAHSKICYEFGNMV
jgi:hypothetical protein